ncbi:MAG: ABC transporter permease [Acholeplasmataceae bacterium]|nr:ABC transporter permease [Acholeplasmataceae bacterium]
MNQDHNTVDKSKLVLANRDNLRFDEVFQTKPIGYFKDAWIRFKKNKASVVAGSVLMFLIFMAIIGPFIKNDSLYKEHVTQAQKLVSYGELPPKINALSWISMFNGHRNIVRSSIELDLRPLEDPENVEMFGKILYTDLDDVTRNPDGTYAVEVDFYNYVNYMISSTLMSVSTETLQEIYSIEEEKGLEIILEENRIWKDADGNLVEGQTHRIRVNYFMFLDELYDTVPEYWFGADGRGRDWFNVLWSGARISLLVALSVSSINIMIGVTIGSISGYFGGTVDLAIERISEIIAGIPFLALITLLILRYGSSIGVVIIAFTLTGWLGISSVTRREFYRYKSREYVLAARTLGATDFRIMSRHILPNAVGTLITSFVLYIPSVIFTESTFAYLGIINYGNVTSVGRMLADAQARLKVETSLGFLVFYPALFVSLLMLSFNLFGNGLRDAFNPSLRGVEE